MISFMRTRMLAAALVLALAPVTAAHAEPPTTGSVSGAHAEPPTTGSVSGAHAEPPTTGSVSGTLAEPPTTGSVSGTLADGGTPVPDAVVELVIPPYGVAIKQARTDAAGAFRLADAPPRDYALRFRLTGGLTQFHPAVVDLAQARLVTVVAGAEAVVQESVMPHGTIGGRITTDTGAPAAGARVELHRITPGGALATALADAGAYEVTVTDDVHPDAVYPDVRVTTGRLTTLSARV